MRPTLQKNSISYKVWILYGLIFLICIIGIGMSMYMQYFKNDKIGVIFGITDSEYEDRYNDLINGFNALFTNDINKIQDGEFNVKKLKDNFDFVVTRQKYKEEKENYFLDVAIPIINIDNENIKAYNTEIYNLYNNKVNEVKTSTGYVYNVRYKSYLQDNILSLVIYSELIEKNNNQRVIIETYNYDLVNNKKLNLEELLDFKKIKTSEANNKIKDEIKEIQKKNDSLIQLGYDMYKRDVNASMYKVSNVEQFFLGADGNIYVIFAYGNYDETSEMDIVIFINK